MKSRQGVDGVLPRSFGSDHPSGHFVVSAYACDGLDELDTLAAELPAIPPPIRQNRHHPTTSGQDGAARGCWLAVLISLALHAALVIGLCLAPGTRVVEAEPAFIDTSITDSGMAFLVSAQTDILDVPHESSIAPIEPLSAGTEPKLLTPSVLEASTSPSSQSRAASTNSAQRTGPVTGGSGVVPASTSAGGFLGSAFFGIKAGRAGRIVYLIDTSGSMGTSGTLQTAVVELMSSIEKLGPAVEFQVMMFNRGVRPLLPGQSEWLTPTAETLRNVTGALKRLQAEGGTDYARALKYALHRQPDVLFFLTDGGAFPPELANEITRFNHGRSSIQVIVLQAGSPRNDSPALRRLAELNRGSFHLQRLP